MIVDKQTPNDLDMKLNVYTRYAVALTLVMTLCACGDDDKAPALKPQLPAQTPADAVKQIQHFGNVRTSYDWTFTYSEDRLTVAAGQLNDGTNNSGTNYSYTAWLNYWPGGMGMTHSNGDKLSLSLNSDEKIAQMNVNNSAYRFNYTDGRLTAWDKTVTENAFGQAQTYHSQAAITYSGGDITEIVYRAASGTVTTVNLTPSLIINRSGLLPETVAEELGLLGLEHLYYAGLMGKASLHLPASLTRTITSGNATTSETISFDYGTDNEGRVVVCNYTTPEGGVASVSYKY